MISSMAYMQLIVSKYSLSHHLFVINKAQNLSIFAVSCRFQALHELHNDDTCFFYEKHEAEYRQKLKNMQET